LHTNGWQGEYFDIYIYFCEIVNSFADLITCIIYDVKIPFLFEFLQKILWKAQISNSFFSQIMKSKYVYTSGSFNIMNYGSAFKYENEELSDDFRYWRFSNPIFRYDYKSGDYLPKTYKEIYTYLFTSVAELSGGLRSAPWFTSDKYAELFDLNFVNYLDKNSNSASPNSQLSVNFNNRINNTDSFYNFFDLLT